MATWREQARERVINSRPNIDVWRTPGQWASLAKVSYQDVVNAVGEIRDAWSFTDPKTGEKLSLVTYFGRNGGYIITRNPAIIERGKRQMIKRALTTIRRTWKGIISPHLERIRPQHGALVDQIQVSFDRLIEDTERVFALSSTPPNGTP